MYKSVRVSDGLSPSNAVCGSCIVLLPCWNIGHTWSGLLGDRACFSLSRGAFRSQEIMSLLSTENMLYPICRGLISPLDLVGSCPGLSLRGIGILTPTSVGHDSHGRLLYTLKPTYLISCAMQLVYAPLSCVSVKLKIYSCSLCIRIHQLSQRSEYGRNLP